MIILLIKKIQKKLAVDDSNIFKYYLIALPIAILIAIINFILRIVLRLLATWESRTTYTIQESVLT